MTRRAAAALVVVAALAPAARADRAAAERYFRAGEKAYHAQDFEAAAQNFELAYKELPLPEIAFSAAQAYRRQYRIDPKPKYVCRAVQLYGAYLAKVKTGGRVADASDGLAEMKHELEQAVDVGRCPGVVEQTGLGVSVLFADVHEAAIGAVRDVVDQGDAPKVSVTIDGRPRDPDKLYPVAPGEHVVRATATGYQPGEKTVRAVAGAPDLVELELAPVPASLVVHTEPHATISIDGRQLGTAPLPAVALAGGHHVVTVTARGREPAGKELDVTRAEHVTVDVPLEPTARRRAVPWVAGAAAGLGVLALVSTAGTLYWNHEALDLGHQLHRGNASDAVRSSYNDAADKRDVARTTAIVTGGLAIGVGLAAAWLYYFDRPQAEGVRVTPMAGPDRAGAMVFGRF